MLHVQEKLRIKDSCGANGYTVIISNDTYVFQYSHVANNYKFSIGDWIKVGDIIAYVGPKYINDAQNEKYKDSTGKYTNGATTGVHLHFSVKENGVYVDPLKKFGM